MLRVTWGHEGIVWRYGPLVWPLYYSVKHTAAHTGHTLECTVTFSYTHSRKLHTVYIVYSDSYTWWSGESDSKTIEGSRAAFNL